MLAPLFGVDPLSFYKIYRFPETMMKFDSYMIHESELNIGDLRLLKTDMPVFLPKNTHIRLLITSSDVLHS
jgi:heme/copper-type cytochrome/quinol oxidase subunit 2